VVVFLIIFKKVIHRERTGLEESRCALPVCNFLCFVGRFLKSCPNENEKKAKKEKALHLVRRGVYSKFQVEREAGKLRSYGLQSAAESFGAEAMEEKRANCLSPGTK